MKKLLSLILSAALMSALCVPAFAADADDMQRVLELVKQRLEDTSEFENFSSESRTQNERVYYTFYWSDEDGGNYRDMSVTADNKGVITNYHYYADDVYKNRDNEPSINKMSQDEALAKTKVLVEELNPDIFSSLVIEKTNEAESLYSDTYSFSIKRVENSVEVYQDTGYVTVNNDAARIISFNLNYTDFDEFEDISGIIDVNGAWDKFCENVGMELKYRSSYEDGVESIYSAYIPKIKNNQYIGALDGKVYDIVRSPNASIYNYSGGATADAAVEENHKEQLSVYEREELEKISGLISEKEAEEKIRSLSALDFDKELVLNSISCNKRTVNDKEQYYYWMRFEYQNSDKHKYAYANVDAKTGELISWETNAGYSEKVIERDELVSEAQKLLPQISAKKFDENAKDGYRLNDNSNNSSSLDYTRYVNGVPFEKDTAVISLNPENKKVSSFYISYTDLEFPSVEKVISAEEASEALSEQAELKLYYILTYKDEKVSAKLGYKLENLYYCELDANTGKTVKDNKQESEPLEYSDISGHYAENAIKTLAAYGIGFESGELMPDKLITQQEYATLLVSTFIRHYPIPLKDDAEMKECFERAQNNDIIRENDGSPEDALTRERAAIYMVRAMGAEKYAELSGIYKPMFSDVSEKVGYISLLAGMGVFKGDGSGRFNPDANLTRADAIMIIYNYLSR